MAWEQSRSGARPALTSVLDRALQVQRPVVLSAITHHRRRRPNASPADTIRAIEIQYWAAMTGSGAAVGGVAAAPGVGTVAALALSAGETVTFLEASALFTLAVAEIHGVRVEEVDRRRTLLMGILLGNGGASFVEKTAGSTGAHWGHLIVDKIPVSSIGRVNKVFGRWFVTKYGTKQGVIVLGRLVPFGVGAAIGGAGNAILARTVIAGTRRAFGPPPADWPGALEPAPAGYDARRELSPDPSADQVTRSERMTGPVEAPTGKYGPIQVALRESQADLVVFTFADLSGRVGGLPSTALTQRSWWGNGASRSQARSWLAAGFKVVDVDLDEGTVTFSR